MRTVEHGKRRKRERKQRKGAGRFNLAIGELERQNNYSMTSNVL
jgi:hypothetical protein